MSSFTYKFVWTNKNKVVQTNYVDAPSLADAKRIFEEWFGVDPKSATITRL